MLFCELTAISEIDRGAVDTVESVTVEQAQADAAEINLTFKTTFLVITKLLNNIIHLSIFKYIHQLTFKYIQHEMVYWN